MEFANIVVRIKKNGGAYALDKRETAERGDTIGTRAFGTVI